MSIMSRRAWEDVYPPIRCFGEDVHGKSCSTEEVFNRIVNIVYARVLRSD
jgi:hypothetical protein